MTIGNLLGAMKTPEPCNDRPLTGEEVPHALADTLRTFKRYRERDGSFYVFSLDDELKELLNCLTPIFEMRGFTEEKQLIGYEISELPYEKWREHWHSSRQAANLIRQVIYQAATGTRPRPMPSEFAALAKEVISGQLSNPHKARSRNRTSYRNYLMAAVAYWVTRKWKTTYAVDPLKLGKRGNLAVCGATISAACMHALGHDITPKTALNICNANKNVGIDAVNSGAVTFRPNALAPSGLGSLAEIDEAEIESAMVFLGLNYPFGD